MLLLESISAIAAVSGAHTRATAGPWSIQQMFLIECALGLTALMIAVGAPTIASNLFETIERAFARLARRCLLSVVVVGLTALVLRAALLPIEPIPEPIKHDEFSYLLAADTFAHGRLSNPTHPMWIHFESFHVNQKPTYASMYYPAQGLFLAMGQVVFGHPFWGVWLSAGLMCAVITWMLQGWLPPIWALLGGLLAVIRLGTFSYWANSYWGGAVAAIGGALVLGALPRIKRHQHSRDAILMGVGLAILANSRPYEGLFFALPVAAAFSVWIFGRKQSGKNVLKHVVLPLGLVLAVTAGAMAFYFWRTTGSPFRTPFMVNIATYNTAPYFPWQSVKSIPVFHHATMRSFYMGWWLQQYEFGCAHPFQLAIFKLISFWSFFLGPSFSLPLLMLVVVLLYDMPLRSIPRNARFLLAVCCVSAIGMLLPVYFLPHYAAPMTSAVYALILITMQRIRRWRWRGEPTGLLMTRGIPTICVIMFLLYVAAGPPLPMDARSFGRATILSELQQLPERHLVVVRYHPDHDVHNEWVYNGADIDSQKVVWARDMSPAENAELIKYFINRRVWLLEADETPPRLSPYPIESLPPGQPRIDSHRPAPTLPSKTKPTPAQNSLPFASGNKR